MRAARTAALVAVLAVCVGCGGKSAPKLAFSGTALNPPTPAPSFTLGDQAGKQVAMAAERGHYVVVTFLYTNCPDVCPVIAGTLNRVLKTPAAHRAGLRVLAISVDPKGDTPAAVRRFVHDHQLAASFRYLTGTRVELAAVWKGFHVAAVAGPAGTVTHSTFEILVDPRGQERLIYDSTVTAAAVVSDLNALRGAA